MRRRQTLIWISLVCVLTSVSGCFVTNIDPVANFSWTVNQFEATFDASPSYDEDGSLTTFLWSFGDGSSTTGENASHTSHTYSTTTARTYQVMLTVADNNGATDSVTNSIQVSPPDSGITVSITASESEIDIRGYEIETQGLWTLVGQAKNVSGQTFDSVSIHARMLDSAGLVIGIDHDMQLDVAAGMTFEFSLFIFEKERVKTLEIYEISTYTF